MNDTLDNWNCVLSGVLAGRMTEVIELPDLTCVVNRNHKMAQRKIKVSGAVVLINIV